MIKVFKQAFAMVFILMGLIVALPAYSNSQTESGRHVQALGVQGQFVYFNLVGGLTLNCEWGNIYFDGATTQGELSYSLLLASKMAGRALSRIDYYQAATGERCYLSLVEMVE